MTPETGATRQGGQLLEPRKGVKHKSQGPITGTVARFIEGNVCASSNRDPGTLVSPDRHRCRGQPQSRHLVDMLNQLMKS